MSGDIKNYVERIIKTTKDRIKPLNKYCLVKILNTRARMSKFLRLFGLYYNHARTLENS